MSDQAIDIQIFGRTLRINCPPKKKDALNKAVENLTQRLQDLKIKTKVTNPDQLIFIAALNICYELNQEKLKTIECATNFKKHILILQENINKALIAYDDLIDNKNSSDIKQSKHT